MRWDLYCRVVDNFGDVGVAWRLATDLARRGARVRLAIDDARPLAWMAPDGAEGVEVRAWNEASTAPPEVVVELFGAGLPPAAKEAASQAPESVVVNLEHLSAEPYVERSHGLPSPASLPSGHPLTTWFFYPGFTPRTGGLLREPDLLERRARFRPGPWLASLGVEPSPGEQRVSLFCYANEAIPELLQELARVPTRLLLTHGPARDQVARRLGSGIAGESLRVTALPALTQLDFDHLLWSCDLNFVRGEDSLVRAIWAGVPFVWQLYRQRDGAHAAKLEAFLDLFLSGADAVLANELRFAFRRWNGVERSGRPLALPDASAGAPWQRHCAAWREMLASRTDLTSSVMEFVEGKR